MKAVSLLCSLCYLFFFIQEFRAFELLRSGSDRANYLLIKEAKVIAMTCTHAALKRRDLVDVGFQVQIILCLVEFDHVGCVLLKCCLQFYIVSVFFPFYDVIYHYLE